MPESDCQNTTSAVHIFTFLHWRDSIPVVVNYFLTIYAWVFAF